MVLACISSPLWSAADCVRTASGLWSDAAKWSCGHVPGPTETWWTSSYDVTIDQDIDASAGNNSTDTGIGNGRGAGSLVSDGNRRTITFRCTAAGSKQNFFISSATLHLKGGDRVVARQSNGVACELRAIGAPTFWMEPTIIGPQRAVTVSSSGTTFTVTGLDTTGIQAGDELWWENGNADGFVYEITSVIGDTVTYQTDLPDSQSRSLHLTPDEGTTGGAPGCLHTLPDVTPASGDYLTLVAPIKWSYQGSDPSDSPATGGAWTLFPVTGATLDAATNILMDGFSYVASDMSPGGDVLRLKFAVSHTGKRSLRYINMGEHKNIAPMNITGQNFGMDRIYCHDSIAGSPSTGACLSMQQCTLHDCGTEYAVQNVFVGHLHVARTCSQGFQIGVSGAEYDPSGVVLFKPVMHDISNCGVSEANGLEMAECSNCLLYGAKVWNIHDPDGSGGFGLALGGNGGSPGSIAADSWVVNTGTGIGNNGFAVINTYVSNTMDYGVAVGGDPGATGTLSSSVVAKWAQNTNRTHGVLGSDMDGVALIGGGTAASVSLAAFYSADRNTAISVTNVLAMNWQGDAGLSFASDQDATIAHVTCGGPMTGARSCITLASVSAGTITVDDIAVDSCGGTGASAFICGPTADNVGKIAYDSDVCGAPTGTCASGPTSISSTDLKFLAPGSANYNVTDTTSPVYRAGNSPTGSAIGVHCFAFDSTRLPSGVTFDTVVPMIGNETCRDPRAPAGRRRRRLGDKPRLPRPVGGTAIETLGGPGA
jgi:hypothetical protein